MNKKQTLLVSALLGLSLALSFSGGYFFHKFWVSDNPYPLLSEAYSLLVDNAYDEIPAGSSLEYGMIRGMVGAYNDPYTIFVEPPQHELQSDTLQGSFGGIGVELSRDNDGLIILHPIQNGPADLAGIEDGDQLLSVDETTIMGELNMEEVVALIRGPEGEEVIIIVSRPVEQIELTFIIERGNIPLPSVTWHIAADEPRLGVIQINLIAESTPEEIINAVEDLSNRGATHFVLDLRGNRGGLLMEGIETATLFLKDGFIIEQQYREEKVKLSEVDKEGKLSDIPMLVLVDRDTASAAEIIAGALQANGRAVLIGVQTFGKDSIQRVYELKDGSSIHVTAARWWFPNLNFPVDGAGLLPDIIIMPEEGISDPGIKAAIEFFFG